MTLGGGDITSIASKVTGGDSALTMRHCATRADEPAPTTTITSSSFGITSEAQHAELA